MKQIIIANWKMHFTIVEVIQQVQFFREHFNGNTHVVFCAPFTTLSALRYELNKQQGGLTIQIRHPFYLGAQNIHHEAKGKFTGEISAGMVKELADYVIIGHSERRLLFGETNDIVRKKIVAALDTGLVPILCFGAFAGGRKEAVSQFVEKALDDQLRACLSGLDLKGKKLLIAYEPVNAIGTGNAADPKRMNHILYFIRRFLAQHFGDDVARAIPLLYGGSANSSNMQSFLQEKEIDGLLVGSASLDKNEFVRMCNSGF
jgi:triosephosphate isomerase (TIM)